MKIKGIVLTLSGIVIVALILFMTKLAIDSNNQNVKQYSEAYLGNETDKIAQSIGIYLESRHNNICLLSEMLSDMLPDLPAEEYDSSIMNNDSLTEILKNAKESLSLMDIMICNIKGSGFDLKGNEYKLDSCPLYQKSLLGESAVAFTDFYYSGDSLAIVDIAPIKRDNELIALVRTATDPEKLRGLMTTTAFRGNEDIFIIERDGDIVLSTSDIAIESNNILSLLDEKADDYQLLIQVINQGKSILSVMNINGQKHSIYYRGVDGAGKLGVMTIVLQKQMIEAYRIANSSELNRLLVVTVILASAAIIILIAISIYEIIKRRKAEYIAFNDPITGGMNFNSFRKFAIRNIQKASDKFAIVQMDIDKFDYIREFFGQNEIKRLQKCIADVLASNMQDDELFCRYSSKYFNILLKYHNKEELANRIAYLNNLIKNYEEERRDSNKYEFILRFGIYLVTEDDNDIEHMVDKANQALLHIKDDRSNLMNFFSNSMYDRLHDENEIMEGMYRAIEEKELVLYLLPKYNLKTGLQVGAEALVRWMHPDKGLLYPGRFISVFERTGFIGKMDMYMLDQMCRLLRDWTKKGYRPMPLSLNISRLNLYDPNFIKNVLEITEKYGVPTELLIFEISEESIQDNMELAAGFIREFRKHGFIVSIDNFGTGNVSLDTLYHIHVDELKLDKSYIQEAEKSDRGLMIIQSIIDTAKRLDIKVVSQGVMSQKQAKQLGLMGCDMLQGFVFSEPLPVNEYEDYAYGPRALDNKIRVS
ncbi:MAG: EAL domain-containing protein [Clostridiales bacterium]|nr:EAL domain-containing protein [Clostridiales bacterium]